MGRKGNFASEEHAIDTGALTGMLILAEVPAAPIVDGQGNYLPVLSVVIRGRSYFLTVTPKEG